MCIRDSRHPMPMEQYIERIAVHSVGNKANGDAILLSSSELMPDESIRNLLATYFLSPFKSEEYYNLCLLYTSRCVLETAISL